MKTTLMVMMAASAVLTGLTACSSDDAAPAAQQTREIRLGTTVGDVTRSNDATNLLNGDTVYVWTDMVNPSTTPATVTEYFNAWALKANGVGGLSTLAAGNQKLFPATNMLNFYALVGNFGKRTVEEQQVPMITDGETELPTTGILHTVLDDQTTAEAYYKSDLMYAVKLEQEPVSDAVILPFKHLLSRIQVVLVPGNGMTTTDLTGATVELLNLYRQVTFSPDKSKDFTSASDLASMISIQALVAQQGNILMSTNTVATSADAIGDANKTAYADAIVVPQTIAKGTQFIHVSYMGRDTYYRIPDGDSDQPLVLESGKQYRFRLVCDRLGDTYLSDIAIDDWTVLGNTALNLGY